MLPLLFAVLFASMRLDVRIRQTRKGISANRATAQLLLREVAEKRHRLAAVIDFASIEPVARRSGLEAVRTGQVCALERSVDPTSSADGDPIKTPLLSTLGDLLVPQSARAEALRGSLSEGRTR